MRRHAFYLALMVAIAIGIYSGMAFGQADVIATQSGPWTDANTWGGLDTPTAADDAQIEMNYEVTISTGEAADAFRVLLGDNASGNTGTLTMTGGTLTTDRVISLGGFEVTETNGIGVINQSGGDIYIGGYNHPAGWEQFVIGDKGTSHGVYNISGGTIDVPEGISIAHSAGATGEMHQWGGAVSSGGYFVVGNQNQGTFSMDAGSVTLTGTESFYVGYSTTGVGTVTQTGGDISTTSMVVSRSGDAQYTMSGGSITASEDLQIAQNGIEGDKSGLLTQSSGIISVTGSAWIANINKSQGTYSLSGDAEINIATDLNVCAAVGKNGSAPSGSSGTLNIDGEGVTITVGGNLVATGGTVIDPESIWVNTSYFNFTPTTTGGLSTIDVTGSADIDSAIFNIVEEVGQELAPGTVLNLIEADGGISNLATAVLSQSAIDNDWTLQLDGTILKAVKTLNVVIPGDTNNDGIVNSTDAEKLASNWGATVGTAGPSEGDFNGDGVVNAIDASIMSANWGNHNESATGAVPEPSAIVLLLGMLIGAVTRRRSH